MDHFDTNSAYIANKDMFGHVRIWQYSPATGIGELLIEKNNLITYQGAGIAARALSGLPNTAISHIYVGYSSSSTPPSPTISDTPASFSTFVRQPLAFSPSFSNEAGYSVPNLAYFTAFITGSAIPNDDYVVALGLVSATNPNDSSGDLLFSSIAFNGVQYNSTYGLAVTWGITFRAQ